MVDDITINWSTRRLGNAPKLYWKSGAVLVETEHLQTITKHSLTSGVGEPISHRMLQKNRVRYQLRKPVKTRKTWSIWKDIVRPDGTRYYEKLEDERIDSINKLYSQKLKDLTECELELKNLIKGLHESAKERVTFHEDNHKIFQTYWEQEYADKENVDLDSARNDLLRALECVGSLSLVSASREQLQKQIDKKLKGNKQRRVINKINQLLKFLKREIKLRKAPKEKVRVRYLTPTEFKKILPFIENKTYRALAVACFITGARIGEAFALEPDDFYDGVVRITKQMDRKLVIRATKNGRDRDVLINEMELTLFNHWLEFKDKEEIRKIKFASIVKEACKRAFPSDRNKWCTVHDLRHSYAIWLLSKGVSLSLVAQSLADSIQVCQEYYTGFVLTSESIQAIRAILKKA